VVCWSTKAAISLKRVKIEDKLLWTAYRNSPTLFRTVPSRPPTASSSPRLGVRNPTQKSNRYYPRKGWSYGLKICPIHSKSPSEQKPVKHFGERGAWAYLGTVQILWVPRISSGMGNATNFKFGRNIYKVHPNKSPLKFLEKRERGHIQGLPNCLGTPNYLRNR